MPHSFHHVHLKAKDPRRSVQWYVEMFGAQALPERDMGGAVMAPFQLGGVVINISSPRPADKLAPADSGLRFGLEHFGIRTDDLDRDLARLKQKGAKVFQEPTAGATGGKIAFVEGPDNVRLELMQV